MLSKVIKSDKLHIV